MPTLDDLQAAHAARCPHCQTVWQVQPEQWRAWQGWVRCGHCLQPFDAALALADAAPAITPARRGAPPIGGDPADWPSLDLDEPATSSPADRWLDDTPPRPVVPAAAPEPTPLSVPEPVPALVAEPEPTPEAQPQEPAAPAFAAAIARPATGPWQRAGRVLIPVLSVLLVGQVLLATRHWQAAWWPSTRAVWLPLCKTLGCGLRPAQDLSAWSLDNTQLSLLPAPGAAVDAQGEPETVDAQGHMRFRLEVSLQRTVNAVVAPPALDLTLVGSDGQPLTQRVISAQELGLTLPAVRESDESQRDGSAVLRMPQNLGENIRTWRARLVYPDAP